MKLPVTFLALTCSLFAQDLPSRWDELTASDWPKAQNGLLTPVSCQSASWKNMDLTYRWDQT